MSKSWLVGVFAVVLTSLCVAGCTTGGGGKTASCDSPCVGGMCKWPTMQSYVAVKIADKGASLKYGIDLWVTIVNEGESPLVLQVCPAMTLCCVKGLHPMIAYDNTGMGLLDVCKSEKPKKHQTFLPSGAELAFSVNIPAKCLPNDCLQKGKKIKVKFCYDCEGSKQVDSNELTVTLK